MRPVPPIAGLVAALLASAAAAEPWSQWQAMIERRCPDNHVEWICDACWIDLLGGFEATLPARTRGRIGRMADIRRGCAGQPSGAYCEATRSLAAYQRLRLLPRFARFSCRTIKCEAATLCSRMPRRP